MHRLNLIRSRLYPLRAWIGVLVSVFVIESLIMIALSTELPADLNGTIISCIDAAILTVTVAPILWWFVVRPLNALLELRTTHLLELFSSIEEERRRVALELHDGVGQHLTILVSGLRTARQIDDEDVVRQRCQELQRVANEALAEVRRITQGMRPSLLDDLGLAPAVVRMAEDISRHHNIEITTEVSSIHRRFPPDVETAAFRIVQEALSNVAKHAAATSARVELSLKSHKLVIDIRDNGRGFRVGMRGKLSVSTGHLGLLGMRERASLLGGELVLTSEPHQGTRILVRIPIENES